MAGIKIGICEMPSIKFLLSKLTVLLLLCSTTTEASSISHSRFSQQHQIQQEQLAQHNHQPPSYLFLPGRSPAAEPTASCSSLTLDAPLLSFVEDEPPRVLHRRDLESWTNCMRIFECKVMSSPPEVNVMWYQNGEVIKATALRDATLMSAGTEALRRQKAMIGLSQMTHRLCLDAYVDENRRDSFQCRVESACQPALAIRSSEIIVGESQSLRPLLRSTNENSKSNRKRNINLNQASMTKTIPSSAVAPLITMITSTRMELAGRDVQLACHAAGSPRPYIAWSVIDEDNENVAYPASDFPFINRLPNGDIIVSTSKTNIASVTLQCEARNSFGADHDTASIILVDE